MDLREMDAILTEIGLSRAAFARVLGLGKNTISRWQSVPGYAQAWLRLAHKVDQAWREIGKEKPRRSGAR